MGVNEPYVLIIYMGTEYAIKCTYGSKNTTVLLNLSHVKLTC